MSANLIGALLGLGLGAVDFMVLRLLATRVDLPETRRVLTLAGLSQLVLFPILGWFVGPLLFGGE